MSNWPNAVMFDVNDETNADWLIDQFNSSDELLRAEAHDMLLRVGKPALGSLLKMVNAPSAQVRYEVNKVLRDLHCPRAMPTPMGN